MASCHWTSKNPPHSPTLIKPGPQLTNFKPSLRLTNESQRQSRLALVMVMLLLLLVVVVYAKLSPLEHKIASKDTSHRGDFGWHLFMHNNNDNNSDSNWKLSTASHEFRLISADWPSSLNFQALLAARNWLSLFHLRSLSLFPFPTTDLLQNTFYTRLSKLWAATST